MRLYLHIIVELQSVITSIKTPTWTEIFLWKISWLEIFYFFLMSELYINKLISKYFLHLRNDLDPSMNQCKSLLKDFACMEFNWLIFPNIPKNWKEIEIEFILWLHTSSLHTAHEVGKVSSRFSWVRTSIIWQFLCCNIQSNL